MKRDLTAGDVVMIYEDPITRSKPEGKATLMIRLWSQPDDLERWTVRFLDDIDGSELQRFILP